MPGKGPSVPGVSGSESRSVSVVCDTMKTLPTTEEASS